jgi:hypothetical protein
MAKPISSSARGASLKWDVNRTDSQKTCLVLGDHSYPVNVSGEILCMAGCLARYQLNIPAAATLLLYLLALRRGGSYGGLLLLTDGVHRKQGTSRCGCRGYIVTVESQLRVAPSYAANLARY